VYYYSRFYYLDPGESATLDAANFRPIY